MKTFLPTSCNVPQAREKFIKAMKRKSRAKYSFDFGGRNYPLHRSCRDIEQGAGDVGNVPKYMGWRWDERIAGIGDKKWFPGHINKTVRCLMKHVLNPFPYDTIPLTRRDANGRIAKICNDKSKLPEFNPALVQRPTLKVLKRDGEFYIEMNPLKDKKKLETDIDPYLNCSPLKFKIKRHPEEIKKHRAKKLLREHGIVKKCSCLNLKFCRCMSDREKKLLAFEVKNVSDQLQLEKELQFGELGDSSDSELELNFTTPSALIDARKFKPDVTHCGTQYLHKDFLPQTKKKVEIAKTPTPKTVESKKFQAKVQAK